MSITAASVILKFKQEEEENIRQALQAFPQVSIEEQAPSGDLILYVEESDYNSLHKTCSELEKIPGTLGVYPCYVGEAE